MLQQSSLKGHPGMMNRSKVALGILLAGGICLGAAPVIVKAVSLSPEISAFYRVLLAMPAFALISFFSPRDEAAGEKSKRPSFALYALASILFAADLTVMHIAIRTTDVAVATLFTNCAPFAVGLMGLVGLSDRPSRRFWQSLPLALFGVLLLIGLNRFGGGSIAGDLLALCAAVFYGGYIVCVRELRACGAHPASLMLGVTIASTVLLLPLFIHAGLPVPTDFGTWLLLFGLVFIGQIAGQGLVTIALKDLPASLGSVILLVQPIVAAILSWLFLSEQLSAIQVGGIVLVLLAIAIATTDRRPA